MVRVFETMTPGNDMGFVLVLEIFVRPRGYSANDNNEGDVTFVLRAGFWDCENLLGQGSGKVLLMSFVLVVHQLAVSYFYLFAFFRIHAYLRYWSMQS